MERFQPRGEQLATQGDAVCNVTEETYAGQQGIIAGWGFTDNNSTMLPNLLNAAPVLILNNSVCNRLWSRMNVFIEDSMLCAGLGTPATCRVSHSTYITHIRD